MITSKIVSRKREVQELASLYTSGKRIQEYICVILGFFFIIINGYFIIINFSFDWSCIIPAALLGIISADFGSGFLHWFADSWGSIDMPVIGRHFLRPFREHHLDPLAITRHDFVETNGDNFMITLLFHAWILKSFLTKSVKQIKAEYFYFIYCYLLTIFGAFTNQIHKWSHMHIGLPRFVKILQNYHIILPRKHHHIHHEAPHATYFCITTGWLNKPLEMIHFWNFLEIILEKITGIKPRTDDMKLYQKIFKYK